MSTNFDSFYSDLLSLIEKHQKNNTELKIEYDEENSIIKIFGEKITTLGRAKNGLDDVIELSHTTAEHHPYWNILKNSSEISNTILEKWQDSLTSEDLKSIDWDLKNLFDSLQKIKQNSFS